MTVGSVIFVLDLSLSLVGSPIGMLYNDLLEVMDSLECHDDLLCDMLLMGTGDDGEGCRWLCGGMCPLPEARDRMGEFTAMGHTPILKAVEEVSGRVAASDDPEGTMVLFITDGQVGFTTAGEMEDAVSGCLHGCPRMVLLLGYNHDEDVISMLASSEDMVFNDVDSVIERMNALVDDW